MTISSGSDALSEDVRNIKTMNGDLRIGPGDTIKFYVHMQNATGVRNVWLYLYGEASAPEGAGTGFAGQHDHGTHNHTLPSAFGNVGTSGSSTGFTQVGTSGAVTPVDEAAVPEGVQIWIDGVNKTASIGNPNTKANYSAGDDTWGDDGSTDWSTGQLDITGEITWTAGEHYIEIKETDGTGGRILYDLYINCDS